jgi:hypothetical protein
MKMSKQNTYSVMITTDGAHNNSEVASSITRYAAAGIAAIKTGLSASTILRRLRSGEKHIKKSPGSLTMISIYRDE